MMSIKCCAGDLIDRQLFVKDAVTTAKVSEMSGKATIFQSC
jgi:hypothetical protein